MCVAKVFDIEEVAQCDYNGLITAKSTVDLDNEIYVKVCGYFYDDDTYTVQYYSGVLGNYINLNNGRNE